MLRAIPISTALLLASLSSVAGPTNTVLRTTAELRALSAEEMRNNYSVDLTGQLVSHLHQGEWIIRDSTGCYNLSNIAGRQLQLGDIIHIQGWTSSSTNFKQCYLMTRAFTLVGHAETPAPKLTTFGEILSGRENYNPVRVRGFIYAIFPDELNPNWNYMIVRDNGQSLYVSVPNKSNPPRPLEELIDVDVELSGVALPEYCADRMFVGPHLELQSMSDISIITPPQDAFKSPRLENIFHISPQEVSKLRRRLVEGQVLAVWHDRCLLLREDSNRLVTVRLQEGQTVPGCGTRVMVVGFPETNLLHINLSQALSRTIPAAPNAEIALPKDISPADILLDDHGKKKLKPSFHGNLIRLHGIVRSLPTPFNNDSLISLDSDGYLVPVESSASLCATKNLSIGCEIEATGICVMETERWSPANPFPVFGGFTLVPRSPEDIVILSRPSWWTPVRLLAVIVSLFAALIAFFVWNRILNRLVERRGRQLFKEQVAHAGTSLKIGERTRLAVELHDSLSQNLAGLACQIAAAKSAVTISPAETRKYLCTAEQMLLSSRTELRRCLWDLRGDTLELDDMTEAVTKTVKPVIGSAALQVRFNVPRTRLLDSTAHSILCIVRELAANAVRHGHATQIRIAGEIHDSTLSFSVRDNGGGFDVGNHPGLADGHFGLTGIRERVDRLDGTFILKSDTTGTNARVTLSVPHSPETEPDDKP